MERITAAQLVMLTSAVVLAPRHAECLSEFEAATVHEVGERYLRDRLLTLVTDEEFLVIGDAVEAMRKHTRDGMSVSDRAERLAELRAG